MLSRIGAFPENDFIDLSYNEAISLMGMLYGLFSEMTN